MRKSIALIVITVLLLALIGCGSSRWTVTFTDGDDVIDTVTVARNNSGVAVACPESDSLSKTGFIFKGWETSSSESDAVIKANVVSDYYVIIYADGVVVSPVWAKAVTIIYEDGQGKELTRYTLAEGDMVPAPSKPTRNGYNFKGWEPAIETATNDMTIVAKWEESKEEAKPQTEEANRQTEVSQVGNSGSLTSSEQKSIETEVRTFIVDSINPATTIASSEWMENDHFVVDLYWNGVGPGYALEEDMKTVSNAEIAPHVFSANPKLAKFTIVWLSEYANASGEITYQRLGDSYQFVREDWDEEFDSSL